jgi:peptidoglycan/xylan/chitin deacetylase (PgdA/CDA1 family)
MPLLAVNHHYFRDPGTGRGIYPTTPAALREEVGKIRSSGWRIGVEDDILAFLSGKLPSDDKVTILTFDDGLREQLTAIQILKDLGASAICYVPTGPLAERRVLDVHKLQMIRAHVGDTEIAAELDREFAFGVTSFDDHLLAIQYRYDDNLGRRVKYFLNFMLDDAARQDWMTEYFERLFGDEKAVSESLYMSVGDLRELSAEGMLGSHAHSHVPLATLDSGTIAGELRESFGMLTSLTRREPYGISYPFGGKTAVSAEVFSAAHSCGYSYGFTMERGVNGGAIPGTEMCLKRIDANDLDYWLHPQHNGMLATRPRVRGRFHPNEGIEL